MYPMYVYMSVTVPGKKGSRANTTHTTVEQLTGVCVFVSLLLFVCTK